MKLGMSSYSLANAIHSGEMTILDVMQWTKDLGGEHIEIVPVGYTLTDNPQLVEDIVNKANELELDISNYAIGADFLSGDEAAFDKEVERVKKEVDIAHQLGVKRMRHDVSFKPPHEASIEQFDQDLPQIVKACQIIADYAKQYDIVTSLENHGFYLQASDRINLIIAKVDRPNFGHTLDTGNFVCVDEDPVSAVQKCLTNISMLHVKDFYIRPASHANPGEGWFGSAAGNYLRGAITGHGDLPLADILKVVKDSGYDGFVSIEFEGMEECKQASKISFQNIKKLWESL
ncbi:sugar phosphate isomerase/epimerase family protein [Gracilibacillus alcaliphilus]|uniref:sugar phosphate isomerase/epimerase family protein n=1 Tax=Gracilibacillus alcaliphilus TaxID=1401441 RepID=UPI00195970A7|nr:sugar phosphate isomerase/epimerase [Gracilibacillus alcaliphilus]MBM7676293.1 sugar phosphate isomerase/epimerase [Gracilibacillus alcaliphilus]